MKRIFAVLTALVLLCALTACGRTEDKSSPATAAATRLWTVMEPIPTTAETLPPTMDQRTTRARWAAVRAVLSPAEAGRVEQAAAVVPMARPFPPTPESALCLSKSSY